MRNAAFWSMQFQIKINRTANDFHTCDFISIKFIRSNDSRKNDIKIIIDSAQCTCTVHCTHEHLSDKMILFLA